jgi:phosphate-selective porin OprO/OprP
MKLSKLTLAIAAMLGMSLTSAAFAIDLYVDTKTKQIFAEPGKGRVKMGSFEQSNQSNNASADKAALEEVKQDLELKNNAIKALEEHVYEQVKDAAEMKLGEKGVEFESKDGNFKFAINGRMQIDAQVNVNSKQDNPVPGTTANNNFGDGTNIRRARLGIEGNFFKDFDYKFEYDFSRGNGSVTSGITDAFIKWNISKALNIQIGQYKEPFSMEEATSNRFLTFIERDMAVNSFSDNLNAYKVGLGVNYAEDRYGIMAAIMTETVAGGWANNSSTNSNGNNSRSGGMGDIAWDLTGRVFGRPWMEDKTQFLHIGASGSYRSLNNNYSPNGTLISPTTPVSFTSTTNGNVDRTGILNTGALTTGNLGAAGARTADHFSRFGAEAALVYGPFSAQAEYIRTDIGGTGYKNTSFDGYYGYVSYFLTGESRNYKSKTGAWDRLKPAQNFSFNNGGWGAWELAAGYDYLDLNSGNGSTGGAINGGRAQTAKVAVNWYPNSHVRFMANFVHVLDISTANMTGRSLAFNSANPDILEFRTQVDW